MRPSPRLSFLVVLMLSLAGCAPLPLPATATPPASLPSIPSISPPSAGAPSVTPSSAQAINPALLKNNMDTLVSSVMQKDQIGACSIAVVYPDTASAKLQTLLFNYGSVSKDSGTPVTSSTEYEIGSITKLFTADLLAWDVQNGKMQLDDAVQKYLPTTVRLPVYGGQAITLRQLATHTSGLPKNPEGGAGTLRVSRVDGILTEGYYSDDDVFNFLDTYELTRPPGSKYEYSNLGFSLLGIAEEQVGNASYDDLAAQEITGVLGMPATRVALLPEQRTDLAQGYYAASDRTAVPYALSGGYLGGGGLRSTIQDMAVYLAANIEPAQTKLAAVLQMTQEKQSDQGPLPAVAMGLGWQIVGPGTVREQFSKDGSTAGFNSYIAFSRIHRTGFVMLCNSANVTAELVPQIYKLLHEDQAPVNSDE